jgi:inner membrane transporter RhtA
MLLTGSVSVQSGTALATQLFDTVGPLGAVFMRLTCGALILLAVTRPGLGPIRRAGFREVFLFALTFAGMNCCFYASVQRIPLGVADTLAFVGPLGVAILGTRRRIDLIWAALAAVGIALLSGGLGSSGLLSVGALLALFAGFFWGCYILQGQRIGAAIPGLGGLATSLAVAAIITAPLAAVQAGTAVSHPHAILLAAAVGLISTVIPYSLQLEALRRLPSGLFGVLMSLEPAVAAMVGLVALSQGLGGTEVVAIVLVCIASGGALRTARR